MRLKILCIRCARPLARSFVFLDARPRENLLFDGDAGPQIQGSCLLANDRYKEPSMNPWSAIPSLIATLRQRLARWLSRVAVGPAPALRRVPVPLRVQTQYRDGWQPRSRYRR